MTVTPERSPLAMRRAAAMRQSVQAIRATAATAQLVALTYDEVACGAHAARTTSSRSTADRAAWARRRAAEERREAQRMWERAAALESAAH